MRTFLISIIASLFVGLPAVAQENAPSETVAPAEAAAETVIPASLVAPRSAPETAGAKDADALPKLPTAEAGSTTIFIVDSSGSMGAQTQLNAARSFVLREVASATPNARVGLQALGVDPNKKSCETRELAAARPWTPERAAEFERLLQSLSPNGSSPVSRSLEHALASATASVKGDAKVRLVLVSDGEDTCGGNICAVARGIRASNPNVTFEFRATGKPQAWADQVKKCVDAPLVDRVISLPEPPPETTYTVLGPKSLFWGVVGVVALWGLATLAALQWRWAAKAFVRSCFVVATAVTLGVFYVNAMDIGLPKSWFTSRWFGTSTDYFGMLSAIFSALPLLVTGTSVINYFAGNRDDGASAEAARVAADAAQAAQAAAGAATTAAGAARTAADAAKTTADRLIRLQTDTTTEFTTMSKRLDAVEADTGKLNKSLGELKTAVGDLSGAVTNLMIDLKTYLGDLKAAIDALRAKL